MSFSFFQKYIKLAINEDLQFVMLIATLVQFQNLLVITYNLRQRNLNPMLKTLRILLTKLKSWTTYLTIFIQFVQIFVLYILIYLIKRGLKLLKKSKPRISTKVYLRFLKLILTLNNFVFNSINCLQEKGCAIGTKCAPSHANIFIGWFEEQFIFPLLTNLSDFYQRLIDDIFLIWNCTKTEFDNFLKRINECHSSIKFEHEIEYETEINFLDTRLFKVHNKLRTKGDVRPTQRQSYLHIKSEHSNFTKKRIARH